MQILVKIPAEKTISVDVSQLDTIGEVKKKIEEKEGIPADDQRLVYAVDKLEDHRTLAEYKIKDKSTINLLLKLTTREAPHILVC
ncbi:Ubiquitin family protein [Euphorbia peplus]|nr:Ubiquitin family protein [Euphorbia peplus]